MYKRLPGSIHLHDSDRSSPRQKDTVTKESLADPLHHTGKLKLLLIVATGALH